MDGATFVMLSTLLLGFEQKQAQAVNLIMFLAVGISSSVSNLKNNLVQKDSVKKLLSLISVGCFLGSMLAKKLQGENLRIYFSVFMVIIGIYEIITSVINIKKVKNNKRERSVKNGMC